MKDVLIQFFTEHKQVVLTVHIFSVVLGMGGATITDILFFNFLRDFTISKKEAEVMRILSNIIMGALVLLYLSGFGLFLSDIERFSTSTPFLSKCIIVLVITLNGILMHKFIAPHMVHLSFLRHPIKTHHAMHTLRKISFSMGAISFTSWYTVFFIAMLKSYIPPEVTVAQIVGVYLFILLSAITVSQTVHYHVHRRSLR